MEGGETFKIYVVNPWDQLGNNFLYSIWGKTCSVEVAAMGTL